MYSLDINFLNDRPEHQSSATSPTGLALPGGTAPIILGAVVGSIFPVVIVVLWLFLQVQSKQLQAQQQKLETELSQVRSQAKEIQDLRLEAEAINKEVQAYAGVFGKLRPWSGLMQGIQENTPSNVQIIGIKQPEAEVNSLDLEITGYANSFSDVNDFSLALRQSPFVKTTEVASATLRESPVAVEVDSNLRDVVVELDRVVAYTIKATLHQTPSFKLIDDIERLGSAGVVARLRALQEEGIVQP